MEDMNLFIFDTNKGGLIAIYSENKKKAMNIFEEKYKELYNQDFSVKQVSLILNENGEYI